MTGDIVLVLSTAPSTAEGTIIGRRLVEEHLAACVNVLPGARSIFFWEGRVQEADEALLVIKTRRARYQDLERRILELHSYSVPEVLALSIDMGTPPYTAWLRESVAPVEGGEG
jgi:periplasmic divalent cation tolerance protein